MNRDFFTVALTAKPDLLRAMLAFNGLLTFPPLPGELAPLPHAAALWKQAAVRQRFGASCAANPDFWDFEDESLRLVFLDTATLDRLALTFGVAVLAPEICRLVRRDDVRNARERLGDTLYAYAVHRARFQVNGNLVPQHICGEVDTPMDLRAHTVGEWGLRAIISCFPEPLQKRVLLAGSPLATNTEPVPDVDQRKQLWMEIKKVLLKEVAPLWAPCFD